jgi:uncharacterized membrane protein YfcA
MKAVPSKEASTRTEQASEASLFDRIGRVVEAFGKFIKYLFGFFVFTLLVAWLTDGFSANWLKWLEVLVLVLTGIGIYKLERMRAEKVAREQNISLEEAIEERREQLLENSTLLIFILAILGFLMTSKIDGTFAAYLFFCFFIVYLYDLFVPRKRAKRKVFDIEPNGFGYKVYAFRKPNGKRRRQVRQNRAFRREEDGETR